jgi:NADPH:quinone reductase-like Zn-dependent oxidoreductase
MYSRQTGGRFANIEEVSVELRVKVISASIGSVSLNYRDKLLYDGLYNHELRFPIVPVADVAGEMIEAGREVRRFR